MSIFNLDSLTPYALLPAASQATTVTGSAVNLMTDDLDTVVISQNVGAVTGSITGKIEDSADGSTGWADLAGAAFTTVSAPNNAQKLAFKVATTRGHIRYVGTIVTGPVLVSACVLGRKKTS